MNSYKENGKLKVIGTDLCNERGEKLQLKGPSTLGLVWYPEYINKKAFETVHGWGANLIRLAMYTKEEKGYLSPDGDKEFTKDLIDKGVKYATDLGMYVIIDWHILSDGNPQTNKAEAIKFFKEMTAKYKDYGNVIYEICNEPNGDDVTWSVVKSYAEEVIPVIREVVPDCVILVGTPCWSQFVDDAANDPLKFPNVMYSLHYYAATHKQELRDRATYALEHNAPIFIDEYSNCDASGNGLLDDEEAHAWAKFADEHNLSYAQWNFANRNETSSMVKYTCSKLSDWEDCDLTETGKWMKKRLKGEIKYS